MSDPIRLESLDRGVYLLTFDKQGSSANVFDTETFASLNAHLDTISGDSSARGVVLVSAKSSIFIAGADIHEIAGAETEDQLKHFIEAGQRTMQRVADLRPVTVAAIHGACLGGGCELALACDWRIATNASATRIGLPEVMLGIIPGWGGCTRMPRLVGIPRALDLILAGKRLNTGRARRAGLIDAVVPRESLVAAAVKLIGSSPARRKRHLLTNNRISAALIKRKAHSEAQKKTRGHYPAVPAAIDLITGAPTTSIANSLLAERKAELKLAQTDACRSLIGVFLLQERAKHLTAAEMFPSAGLDTRIEAGVDRTAVIGAGIMGAGIAQWLSAKRHPVLLRDISDEQVRNGMASIARVYASGLKRKAFDKKTARDGLDRVYPSAREVPLREVDLVIEAAVENLPVKKQIFQRLEQLSRADTVLATNTSALSIDEIADAVTHPGRVIGLHFFNPVHRMQLVEIVVGKRTDPRVAARMLRFVQGIGKLPVVTKDAPGFLVNRILMPYLVEAGLLFAGGGKVETIDRSMLEFGMPMGPLTLIDQVGVDVANHVASFLGSVYSDRMPVPVLLKQMADAGVLGKKSGSGFYDYSGAGKGRPPVNESVVAMQSAGPEANLTENQMQRRMVLLMVNESARCLEEEVVRAPEDVDLAMVMGTGFAPFRGGPLRYADTFGVSRIVGELDAWASSNDTRFTPCELLKKMAANNGRFYNGRI